MYKNFTIQEFIYSKRAIELNIDNTPNETIISNINELIENLLQPIRDAYGKPIIITSGYRCELLNNAVGGVKTSSHLKGYAADCVCSNMKEFDDFCNVVKDYVIKNNIAFDQIIIERNSKGNKWLHIAIRRNNKQQRRKIFNLNVS